MVDYRIRSKVAGSLLGVCIGDALGMPVEMWKHERVIALNEGRGVLGFMDPGDKREWATGTSTVPPKAGDTTDDWQLTEVVLQSLIWSGGYFNQVDCAQAHVRALDATHFGWGGTTRDSIRAIKNGQRNLAELPTGTGAGNGVIMKIAPVAHANFLMKGTIESLWNDTFLLGRITHPVFYATLGAYAVARFIRYVLETEIEPGQGCDLLERVIAEVEAKEGWLGEGPEIVSAKLKTTAVSLGDADTLRNAVGCSFHSLDTVGYTIGVFLRHPRDFRADQLCALAK